MFGDTPPAHNKASGISLVFYDLYKRMLLLADPG